MRCLSDNPTAQFPITFLKESLGKDGKYITQVLEFMEEKGWAEKVKSGVGLWHIN
jgi:hypothetical protein